MPSSTPPSNSPSFGRIPLSSGRDDGYLLVPRRVLYLQAALITIVALLAFIVGYMIGSADRGQVEGPKAEVQEHTSGESTDLSGELQVAPSNLSYKPGTEGA